MRGTGHKSQCASVSTLDVMLEKFGFLRVVMEMGVLRDLCQMLLNTVIEKSTKPWVSVTHDQKGKS